MLDVDERMRRADLDRYGVRPLFASRMLESILRPVVEDAGRLLRAVLLRVGLAGGGSWRRGCASCGRAWKWSSSWARS